MIERCGFGMYEKRSYRNSFDNELVKFSVCIGETDLLIGCDADLSHSALRSVRRVRSILNRHIDIYPEFKSSLGPLRVNKDYNNLVNDMIVSGIAAGTGPMASVAGAVAEYVGRELLKSSKEVFVENGGDIFFASKKDRVISIFAGESVLSNKVAVKIKADKFPVGICTSSGTVGHSFSMGKADAVTIISKDTALADAVATATCNRIQTYRDIKKALDFAIGIEGILGALAIIGDKLGVAGEIELAPVAEPV